jgi:hypothetical protein
MNKQPAFGLVERARALQSLIARDADEIERTRRLTPAVTAALIENGLYRALLPHVFGGAEAPLEIFMQMQEEIAKADASTAWCLGQCSVCAMTAAYLDRDAAEEIFNTPPGILAWGAIAHEVKAVPGGYMANARWDFASGSRQASWLGAHVRVVEADGTPRKKKDGSAPAPIPIQSRISSFPTSSQRCATIPAQCANKARSTSSRPIWYSAWALPRPRSASPAPRLMPRSSSPAPS